MPVLNEADDLKLGATQVNEAYLGAVKVWPSTVTVPPITDPITAFTWWSVWWADGPAFIAQAHTDGAGVDRWPPEGASIGADLYQGTAARQPIFRAAEPRLNNRAAVVGDGVDDYLLGSFGDSDKMVPQPSVVLICAPPDANADTPVLAGSSSSAGPGYWLHVPAGDRIWACREVEGSVTVVDELQGGSYAAGGFNARLFVIGFGTNPEKPGAESFMQIDDDPATETTGTFGMTVHAGSVNLFKDTNTAVKYAVGSVAFIGVYGPPADDASSWGKSHDIRQDPNWPGFVAWARSYYGVP